MINLNNNLLPIGSVVKLKGGNCNTVIVGYKYLDNGKVYDYCGAIYPIGLLSKKSILVFNKEIIENILFIGYKNDMYNDVVEILDNKEIYEKIVESAKNE